ncbi:MAG TPA: type II secretion system F family protein, partial [Clostridia bacterium]|nr:type II secretion system F family protein [Clostridia bacterium]
ALVLRVVLRGRLTVEKRLAVFEQKLARDEIRKQVRDSRKKVPIKVSQLLREQLASAGVPMKAEEYLTVWVVLAFAPALVAALFDARVIVCVVLAGVGLALPPLYVRQSRVKRVKAFEGQLGNAIISISNCLKSGLTFQQGMANVADQMPQPISGEFGRTLREIQLGNTVEAALTNLSRRMPSPDLRLMITAILISQQVGGSLSEVMDNIAQTILDRLRVKKDVHMLTSQGRMTGIVIGSLPIGIGLILSMINPDYMQVFFTTQAGRIMLGIAVGMEVIGFIVIRKMIDVRY